jgi:putative ABC transport system permease protein
MIPLQYNLRSLLVRRTTSLATLLGTGLVVFVFSAVLMLGAGIRRTLATTGRSDVALVLRQGSDAEVTSAIPNDQVGMLLAPREVARRTGGEPDGVAEALALLNLPRRDDGALANVQVRGVGPEAYEFRPDVKLLEGRRARPGTDECVVGRALRGRFDGLLPGQRVELSAQRSLQVVGIFEAAGSALESEVWADVDSVRSAFAREGYVQSVRVRLTQPAAFDRYARAIEGQRQLGVRVERESAYYERQSDGAAGFILGMGTLLAILFSLAAGVGAMITSYSAVAHRKREVGLLRALGFGGLSIVTSFLLESVVLALVGGLLGVVGSLALSWVSFSVVNAQGWNEQVVRFEPHPGSLLASLVLAAIVGALGGVLPALQAARWSVVRALHD